MKKQTRLFTAAMAAVMAVSALPIAGSAELISPDIPSEIVAGENLGDEEIGYDEADWQEYKDWFAANSWYFDKEDPLRITNDGLIYAPNEEYGVCDVVHYIGKAEDLVIPEEINGLKVDSFHTYYEYNKNIHFFDKLPTVKTLTIEAKVDFIPNVFRECPELEKVTFPDTVKYFTDYENDELSNFGTEEGCWAFYNCPKLKEVNIPGTIERVNGAAFKNTPWLTEREEKEKLVVVGKVLLSGRKAEGRVVVPEGVEYIAGDAFDKNNKMTELVIARTVKGSGDLVIGECNALEKITVLNGATYFAGGLVYSRTPNLKKIIIPPSMTYNGIMALIGDWATHISKPDCVCYYYKGTDADKLFHEEFDIYGDVKCSVLPGKTKSFTATPNTRCIEMKWKKVSTATGYQVKVATNKSFKHIVKTRWIDKGSPQPLFCRVRNLKKGQKYYVKMRTYRTIAGKKYYGNYTKIRTVIVK